jgi:uncharacterized protein
MRNVGTYLGCVVRVIGSKLFIEISEDLPSSTPIVSGQIYKIGQIGSYVKIPLGSLNIFGIVTMVGSNSVTQNLDPSQFPFGKRWLEVQLIGESIGQQEFLRGVSVYPTIDDEVHLITINDLRLIHASSSPSAVEIGKLASSDSLPAYLDIDKLLSRHGAIVGSTGSGKSNAVTCILRSLTNGIFPNSKIILIDPHSEYHTALGSYAKVFSIDDKHNPLKVPFWGLTYNELALILFDKKQAADSQQDILVQEKILQHKLEMCKNLKTGKLEEYLVTTDTPIPFNLKKILYDLYEEEHATVNEKQNLNTKAYVKENGIDAIGDWKTLKMPKFIPPGNGSATPFKYKEIKILNAYLNRLHAKLADNKLSFLFDTDDYDGQKLDLGDLLNAWLNHDRPITVLDLGGVPFEVMDMVVGLISRILFESTFWGRDLIAMGRNRPILMVYEEAHSYLPRGGSNSTVTGYASRAVRRICKEGRKYGIGALIVSQRPSDLDEAILSQCGTFFALRLSNTQDQGIISAALPDNLGSLSELLPSLRTGEAIVVGEGVKIPSRIRLQLMTPRPDSQDPEPSKVWKNGSTQQPDFNAAIRNWRHQAVEKTNKDQKLTHFHKKR